jgi:hypothetical protein
MENMLKGIMVSSIKMKNGEEWFMSYTFHRDDIEIEPFQTDSMDKRSYLPDGEYELEIGRMTIKNRKIVYINRNE